MTRCQRTAKSARLAEPAPPAPDVAFARPLAAGFFLPTLLLASEAPNAPSESESESEPEGNPRRPPVVVFLPVEDAADDELFAAAAAAARWLPCSCWTTLYVVMTMS